MKSSQNALSNSNSLKILFQIQNALKLFDLKKCKNHILKYAMDKATIAEIRKVVKNPVEFIEKRIDMCTLFLIKHLEIGSWLFASVVLGATASVFVPSSRPSREFFPSNQLRSDHVNQQLGSKSKAPSSAIAVKPSNSASQQENKSLKSSLWSNVSDRIRRFPLTAVISVRPTDPSSKVRLALSLKLLDQTVYQPVYSDKVSDASNKPVMTYGIYFDTYSATKPIWEPWLTAENRKAAYQRLAASLLKMKSYFFAQSSSNEEIEDIAARTIALMRSDTSPSPFVRRTQSNFPIGRSASFSLPSAERRMQLSRMLDEAATPEPRSMPSEGMERKMNRLVNSVQTSFVLRIDFLKTLIVKIEQ